MRGVLPELESLGRKGFGGRAKKQERGESMGLRESGGVRKGGSMAGCFWLSDG